MFNDYEKALKKIGLKVEYGCIVGPRGDVVAFINAYGEVETKDPEVLKILSTKPKTKKTEVDEA